MEKPRIVRDEEAGVIYIIIKDVAADHSVETDERVIIRYRDGELIGFTIVV